MLQLIRMLHNINNFTKITFLFQVPFHSPFFPFFAQNDPTKGKQQQRSTGETKAGASGGFRSDAFVGRGKKGQQELSLVQQDDSLPLLLGVVVVPHNTVAVSMATDRSGGRGNRYSPMSPPSTIKRDINFIYAHTYLGAGGRGLLILKNLERLLASHRIDLEEATFCKLDGWLCSLELTRCQWIIRTTTTHMKQQNGTDKGCVCFVDIWFNNY